MQTRIAQILGMVGLLLLVVVASVLYSHAWFPPLVTAFIQIGTIVSLGLAIYQLCQVGKTNRSLRDISESMSTKFIGEFPDHMPEITRLLESAEKKVTIVCDLLGYGYYSSPGQYQQYRAAIFRLNNRNVQARIAIYGEERAGRAARDQLGMSFDVISKSETYRNYLKFYKIAPEDAPKNIKEFYARWDNDYREQCREYNVGLIDIHKVEQKSIPVYFWIVDDKDAIFSFPSLSIEPPEVAFRTADRNLIDIFQRILRDVDPMPIA